MKVHTGAVFKRLCRRKKRKERIDSRGGMKSGGGRERHSARQSVGGESCKIKVQCGALSCDCGFGGRAMHLHPPNANSPRPSQGKNLQFFFLSGSSAHQK